MPRVRNAMEVVWLFYRRNVIPARAEESRRRLRIVYIAITGRRKSFKIVLRALAEDGLPRLSRSGGNLLSEGGVLNFQKGAVWSEA